MTGTKSLGLWNTNITANPREKSGPCDNTQKRKNRKLVY